MPVISNTDDTISVSLACYVLLHIHISCLYYTYTHYSPFSGILGRIVKTESKYVALFKSWTQANSQTRQVN